MSEDFGNEYDVSFFEWNTDLQFNLKEACALMCREVVRNRDVKFLPTSPVTKTGNVVGVLAMNDEIEVIVRFPEEMLQLCKTEFCGDYKLVPE